MTIAVSDFHTGYCPTVMFPATAGVVPGLRQSLRLVKIFIKVKLINEVTLPPARVGAIKQQPLSGTQRIKLYPLVVVKLASAQFVYNPTHNLLSDLSEWLVVFQVSKCFTRFVSAGG